MKEMVEKFEEKVKREYMSRIENDRKERSPWMKAIKIIAANLTSGSSESNVVNDVLGERFPELAEQYSMLLIDDSKENAWTQVCDEGDVETAQRVAVKTDQLNLALKNVFGIFHDRLLHLRKATTEALKEKIWEDLKFHHSLVKTLKRAKIGSQNLSANIKSYEDTCNKKRKEKEDDAKQRSVVEYYPVVQQTRNCGE